MSGMWLTSMWPQDRWFQQEDFEPEHVLESSGAGDLQKIKVLDAEVRALKALGVEIRTRIALGADVTLRELRRDFRAVFLGVGAGAGARLGVGEGDAPGGGGAPGVVQAADWLRDVRMKKKVRTGKRVAVIGGGFTAVDAARTA